MWLIRVIQTRTLIGSSLRMLATHTSFSTTNTAQLPVPIPLHLLLCLASETVWGRVRYMAEVGKRGWNIKTGEVLGRERVMTNRHILQWEERGTEGKGGRESEKEEETKHLFNPAIKATAGACDLQPVTCVQTIPCVLYIPVLRPMPSHFYLSPHCQWCKTIPY